MFVPVYCENNHYSLAVYNVMENILDYLDLAVKSFVLEKIYTILKIFEKVFKVKPLFRRNDNIPKQKDMSNDCGVMICWYIKTIYNKKKLRDVGSVNTDAIHKHFQLEIKNIVFNNMKGDLSKVNEVWSFEENLDVVENIDKIDKIDRSVIVQNSSFLSQTSKL